MVRAVLFDLDGVLVSTRELHRDALLTALREHGRCEMSVAEHDAEYNGLPTAVKLARLVTLGRLDPDAVGAVSRAKQAATAALLATAIKPDGAKKALMAGLIRSGYRLGVVSNAIRLTVVTILALAGLDAYMTVVVSNEDIDHPKPAPDGWLLAMRCLNVTPDETLVVEDSIPGRLSAHASGAHVLEVDGPEEVTIDRLLAALADVDRRAA